MEKIYIAGSLFKQGDIKQRLYEESELKKLGFTDIFNPISAPFNEDKSSLPTPCQIYNGDLEQVIDSDYIMASLDDNDLGVCVEIGIANGFNYALDELERYMEDHHSIELKDGIRDFLKSKKRKTIFATCSDIRLQDANKYEIPSYSMNHFLLGAVLENGFLDYSVEESMVAMKKYSQFGGK